MAMFNTPLAILLAAVCCSPAMANLQTFEDLSSVYDAGRQFYSLGNDTNLAITSGILILVALLGAPLLVLFLSANASINRRQGRSGWFGSFYDSYARSAGSSIDFSNLNVIQWISMMQEIYEKFDYNDIECQKRLICEVMQSPEYFGEASDKMRTGFEYARFLEVLSMPDDFREILDEYIDASERAVGVKTCQEYFDCPYSLKDSVKRNFYGNAV